MTVRLATVEAMHGRYVPDWILDLRIDEERSFGDAGPDLWSAVCGYFIRELYRPN